MFSYTAIIIAVIAIWDISIVQHTIAKNFTEHNPILRLKSAQLFAENRTFKQNETYLSLPRVFEELTFECNSTIPTRWTYLSQQVRDFSVKKVDITKWHFQELDGIRTKDLFYSTFKVLNRNPTNMMELACENVCPTNERDCHNLNTYLEEVTFPSQHIASFNLRYAHGNRFTRHERYKVLAPVDDRLGYNEECKYSLHVDLELGLYACVLAENGQEEVPTIFLPCGNPNECETLFKNNGDSKNCNTSVTFQTTCTSKICSQIRTKTPLFVIGCGEYNSNSAARGFYKTLDDVQNGRQRIFEYNKTDVPFKQMVQISLSKSEHPEMKFAKNKEVIFTNYTRQFTCTALKSFFSYGFMWKLIYKNGKEVDLGIGEESTNDTTQLYISKKTVLFDDPSIKTIVCEAPNWKTLNGTDVPMDVTVKESVPPYTYELEDYGRRVFKETKKIKMDAGNEGHVLQCNRTGKPPAYIIWKFDGVKPDDSRINETLTGHYSKYETHKYSRIRLQPKFPFAIIVCILSNNAGTAQVSFEFTRGDLATHNGSDKALFSIIAGAAVLLILVIGIAWYKIRATKKGAYLTEYDIDEFLAGTSTGHDAFLQPYNFRLEVPRDNFFLDTLVLGSGTFGKVVKGHIGFLAVAIKVTKSSSESLVYVKTLLREIKIMSYVGNHPNIVNLIGACTLNLFKNEVYVIMEFCERGDLCSILKKGRANFLNLFETFVVQKDSVVSELASSNMILSTKHLIRWAIHIIDGMDFICSKNVIHGDLAARNVLITYDLRAKVSDFGLSKQINLDEVYVLKTNVPMPVRWMAYESLKNLEFTTLSDIWSLGVTLWEIFSLGNIPYENYVWDSKSSLLLDEGIRLEKPIYASREIYELMYQTWKINPEERPSYSDLRESLNKILSNFN